MTTRFHAMAALLLLATGLCVPHARSADSVDALARDVERLISLREVKDLQRLYTHHAQAGRWNEIACLFTDDARFIHGREALSGRKAIAEWLTRRGGGRRGPAPGAMHASFIDQPLANMSVDGRTVKIRWLALEFTGDG